MGEKLSRMSRGPSVSVPPLMSQNIEIFACPGCGGTLTTPTGRLIECTECKRIFDCKNGIPLLFWPNESAGSELVVTDSIKSFYEENPFPDYEDRDSNWSLTERAKRGIFARLLDEQVSQRARVLDIGCGTGQLSNFLGMTYGRTVFGCDLSLASLKLAEEFRERNQNDNVGFLQMNLFRPAFKPENFDLVICNGVLHHTAEPFLGLQSISRLLKKGGYMIVGLYNLYGRILTDIRRVIFRFSGKRLLLLDPRLRDREASDRRKHVWLMDQYSNPHESKHSIGEVLGWFDQTGLEFVNSIPKLLAFAQTTQGEELFEKNPKGTRLDHFLVQLGILLSGGREGGFFVMIGRKQ